MSICQTLLVCLSVGIYELSGCFTVCYGQLGATPYSGLWRLSERWKASCWRGDKMHQDWYKLMSKIDVLPANTWLTPRRILETWCSDCVKPTIYCSSTLWDLLFVCVRVLRVPFVLLPILIFDNNNFISMHLYYFFPSMRRHKWTDVWEIPRKHVRHTTDHQWNFRERK
jgi:hypothetical protein